jgi:hypothetical protein
MTAVVASPDHDIMEEIRQQYRAEEQFYWRMIRCMVLLAIFSISILVLKEHHEDAFVIVALTLLGLWLLYASCYISCHLCCSSNSPQRPASSDTAGLTSTTPNFTDEDEEDSTTFFAYDIDETPTKIRECQQEITTSKSPTNGTYNVVFSAIYFGKALRSEGQLELQFEKDERSNRGWNLKGWSIFKERQLEIREGYVNAKGEVYWITETTIYRGGLDFQSSTLFDGEFVSESGSPRGRIVRLELSHVAIEPLTKPSNRKLSRTTLELSQLSSNRNRKVDHDEPFIFV